MRRLPGLVADRKKEGHCLGTLNPMKPSLSGASASTVSGARGLAVDRGLEMNTLRLQQQQSV